MEEGNEKLDGSVKTEKEDLYSKAIRAGKRTYFFDVKTTRHNDLYLTITESRKRYFDDGRYYFEKYKIFLYKEDFVKFADGLTEMIDFIQQHQQIETFPGLFHEDKYNDEIQETGNSGLEEVEVEIGSYSNIEFDDLEEKKS